VKITTEKDDQSQYIVRIVIEAGELEAAKGKAAKKLSNQVRVPGFRPGKAPRALIERIVGPEALVEEATKILMPKAYKEALESNDIKPIGDPDISIESQDPLTIVATIPVEPTVELGDYASIRHDLPNLDVSEEEITKVLQDLREQNSTWEEPETERPAQEGDQIELSLQSIRDGEPEGEIIDRTGVIGKGELLSQIDEQVRGMSIGEEKTVEIKRAKPEVIAEEGTDLPEVETIPDEEEETGPLAFHVILKSIKVKNEPELDDTFAASVSELSTIEELTARLTDNLKTQKEEEAKRGLVDKFVKDAVEQAVIRIPPIMVHAEIEAMEQQLAERLKQQKLSLNQYLAIMGKGHEEFHEELHPQAVSRIHTALVLREIATAEGIAVSSEETDREVEKMVEEYTQYSSEEQRVEQVERLKQVFNQKQMRDNLTDNLFSRKLADKLVEIATGVTAATLVEETPQVEATEEPEAEAKPKAKAKSKPKAKATEEEAEPEAEAEAE
jgi:trigger factor